MALVVAGALLLTPGFFTDTIGFLLLFPPTRARLAGLVAARVVTTTVVSGEQRHGPDARVIDGVKYRRED